MRADFAFVAERAAACHAGELLRGSAHSAVDPGLALTRAGSVLASELARALAPLCGGDAPEVTAAAPQECTCADLAAQAPPLAVHSQFAVPGTAFLLLATLEGAAALRLVDRAFGGRGSCPDPLPASLPLSAELVAARIGDALSAALTATFDADLQLCPPARSPALDDSEAFHVLALTVSEPGQSDWNIAVAIPAAALVRIFGDNAASPARPRDPAAERFAALPLTLRAVLVDMRVPYSALARLQPGDVLPVAVARSVPLRLGNKTLAHGAVGECDDRVALSLTQAF